MFKDGSENQFTFACCVTGVDDFSDGFILHEFQDGRQLFLPTAPLGFVLKGIGNERQTVNGSSPILELIIIVIHVLEFQEVADGPSDDNVLAMPVGLEFFADSQDVSKVLGNTGFLSNDDDGHVLKAQRRPYLNPPLVFGWFPLRA